MHARLLAAALQSLLANQLLQHAMQLQLVLLRSEKASWPACTHARRLAAALSLQQLAAAM
ncbi:MAG: hypothetical protein NTV29_06245 [Planctomycetota bacterium]|nr:hypothetical protein [Planctomycetota bacterium]